MLKLIKQYSHKPNCPKSGTSKKGFGQVKIMKKIVWINRQCFLNLVFEQVGEKKIKPHTAKEFYQKKPKKSGNFYEP